MKKWALAIAGIMILAAAWTVFFLSLPEPEQTITLSPHLEDIVEVEPVQPQEQEPEQPTEPDPNTKPEPQGNPTLTIPGRKELSAPFVVQAPFANWEHPYDEACEEASVLTVHHFYKGTESLTEEEMKADLDAMTAWGLQRFNGEVDTNAAETAHFFTDYLGYDPLRVFVRYNISIDDIKAVLAQGYPVIVPVAGQDIGNRYFRQPGPLYHMLVITGYDKDSFITNDPGTKFGAAYTYDQQVLYDAIHDLTPVLENIREGRKAMIIVKP